MITNSDKQRPIGVMDSGLGGLSVLKEILKLMPNENYIYYGDSANAPYGTRDNESVYQLTKKIVQMFIEKYDVKAVVIACNTATSAAAERLRREYSIPIIGLEPAIKPAVMDFSTGKIIVMATPLTLAGSRFEKRTRELEATSQIIKVPAPGLVEFVEKGELFSSHVINYLHQILDDQLPSNAVVLGCTHFPFVKEAIQKVVGSNVSIYDGGNGAARQLQAQLVSYRTLKDNNDEGTVKLLNSNPVKIELMEKLLKE